MHVLLRAPAFAVADVAIHMRNNRRLSLWDEVTLPLLGWIDRCLLVDSKHAQKGTSVSFFTFVL